MMIDRLALSRWCFLGAVLTGLLTSSLCSFAQPFRADIDRWTAQDALDAPAPGAILFTGSSSIRRYEQLALDFADYNIIQRGFGGSQFEDLAGYVNDIVLPYQPAGIVVWEGTNDIATGESSAEVFADYQNFVDLVHTTQPGTPIFFLGIMPTPGRLGCCETRNIEANTAIANFSASNPALHYVDLPAAFYALDPPSGRSFRRLFADDIHLNRQGYELWTSIIRPQIEAVIAPNKIFTLNPNTPQPGNRILFDFGPSNSQDGDPTLGPDENGNIWNNWHPAQGGVAVNAGEHLGSLADANGVVTGIELTITGGFVAGGKSEGGLLSPDATLLGDLAIATATQDYFLSSADNLKGRGDEDRPGGFLLDGLDPALAYDFSFFASRTETDSQQTEYLVTGANNKKTLLLTTGNEDKIALVTGIRPDEFGQVFIDLTLTEGRSAYIAAMEIRVVAAVPEPATAPLLVLAFLFLGQRGVSKSSV